MHDPSILFYGEIEMSYVYQALPGYCPWHQAYDYDYLYSYGPQPLSHVDVQHYPAVGEHWYGMHIYENCKYCFQPLVATGNPTMNYCPNCGAYQYHRV